MPGPDSKTGPVGPVHLIRGVATSVVAAIEAVVVVMVMMVVIIPPISRHHHDRRVVVIAATIEAVVVMMMVVMIIELSDLNIFAGFWRSRFIEGLQSGAGVCDRLQQVGV